MFRNGVVGSYGNLFVSFLRNFHIVFQSVVVSFYISINNKQGFVLNFEFEFEFEFQILNLKHSLLFFFKKYQLRKPQI